MKVSNSKRIFDGSRHCLLFFFVAGLQSAGASLASELFETAFHHPELHKLPQVPPLCSLAGAITGNIRCRLGTFGSKTSLFQSAKEIVLADPRAACVSMIPSHLHGLECFDGESKTTCEGKIVLAFRGVCPFYPKALRAMHAGAAGIMIANSKDEPLMTLARGSAPGHSKINEIELKQPIPVVSILKEDGERMERAIYQHEKPLYGDLFFNHQWKDMESEFDLRVALQDKPKNADLANNLAIALAKQGKRDQAISAWQGALELEPKVDIYALLGKELEASKRFAEAEVSYNSAAEHSESGGDKKKYQNLANSAAEKRTQKGEL